MLRRLIIRVKPRFCPPQADPAHPAPAHAFTPPAPSTPTTKSKPWSRAAPCPALRRPIQLDRVVDAVERGARRRVHVVVERARWPAHGDCAIIAALAALAALAAWSPP
ncbi:MAG: hypothetical protein FJ100_22780, partial [Deltaproteobacteria bacterium]|nr:hypothetical protein [Deltaproteobacteria bacterium]